MINLSLTSLHRHACKEVAVVVAADVEANLPKFPLDLPRRQSDGPSKETAYHSMKTSSSECPRLPKFEFEAQLHESTLYRRARDSTCDGFPSASPSLNPLARPSHGLDIPSVISAVALPLTKEELSNPELYAFDPVPQSHISDRTVGHLTLHELQAIVAAQSRSAFAQCMAYTFQTVSKSSLDVRVGKHSSSAECEGSGAEEERLPVACMSSLYFNQDSQAWPSASEIGAQLSACELGTPIYTLQPSRLVSSFTILLTKRRRCQRLPGRIPMFLLQQIVGDHCSVSARPLD